MFASSLIDLGVGAMYGAGVMAVGLGVIAALRVRTPSHVTVAER